MGHHNTVTLHQLQFVTSRPHAVGHDGWCLSEESVAVVGIAIALALWLQLGYPGNLRGVL